MPDELEWLPSSVAFFLEGRSWPFTSPLHLLRFSPLSLRSRLRMGVAVLRLQRGGDDVAPFERMTARAWIRDAMGAEAYEKVWGPLLRGKFGDRADDISMAWLWGKLTMRRKLQGKESRQELLGYPRHSWEPLFAALQERIEAGGGRVLIDRPVKRLSAGLRDRVRGAGVVPLRPRPARLRGRRQRALRRRRRHRAQRRLPRAARPRARAGLPASAWTASSTTRRSACCSSSTAPSRPSTGPTSPTPSCRSSA